jgi:hypothetical protein
MNFTIPTTTPPGKYLLRVEHLYVRPAFNTTQFYIACAQIEVLGQVGGGEVRKPEPEYMVKFPGAYDLFDEGEPRIPVLCRRERQEDKKRRVAWNAAYF